MSKKKLGLALGVGGLRGAAHIGVIKCLVEHKITIDYVAGCSTGALVGSLFCQDGDITKVESFFKETQFLLAGRKYIFFLEYRRKLNDLKNYLGDTKIEDLKIPFSSVASDIDLGEPHVFEAGQLFRAVSASVAVPLLMPSVHYQHHTFVDGALTMPIPVEIAQQKTDIVLAVNLLKDIFPMNSLESLGKLNNLIKGCYSSVNQLIRHNLALTDFVIEPNGLTTSVDSEELIDDMINSGYNATLPLIHRIQSSL